MQDAVGSLIRRALAGACLMLTVAIGAGAQTSTIPPSTLQFLPRCDFGITIAGLADEDARFSWDGRIGADLDVVDYGAGRSSVLVEYQVVMGNQLQLFDPNQGNCTLEAASSVRVGATELVGMFHHVSRHLSDRAKNQSIAMNVLGGRVLRRLRLGSNTIDIRGDVGKIVQRSYVDYTWRVRLSLIARRPLDGHVGLFGRASGETYSVNPILAGRQRQNGGRFEGGVRLSGKAGSAELFAGYERVVDADPLDRRPRQWPFAGFRLVN